MAICKVTMTSVALSFVDGQLADSIPINDRGLAYGDGCFTTALIIDGEVAMLPQHLDRLVVQSQKLGLPDVDLTTLKVTINNISADIHIGVLKVIITCGSGGRGYSRLGVESAKVIVSVHDYPTNYPQWQKVGISVGISEQKLGINPMLAGLKHLNRLEQVMLRVELDKRSEDDLLACDVNGNVIECCSANVFWLKAGKWHTPMLSTAGVAGLMREKVLLNYVDITPANYALTDLNNIDAMFITNAILGIVPVKIFNDHKLDISLVSALQSQCMNTEVNKNE
jgi:4-amino-4-deoxychorismate lyase